MPNDDARQIAFHILNKIDQSNSTLDEIVVEWFKRNSHLKKRDKALITQLTFGVLRWRYQLDWIIQHFSKIKVVKIDPPVLNILRMGLFQIRFLDRIPNSAAVNTSVELAKSNCHARIAGFVNGILRSAIRKMESIRFPSTEDTSIESLAVNVSLPEWLLKRWVVRFGWGEAKSICDEINQIPPITVRTNTLKTTRQELVENLLEETSKAWITRHAQDGISFTSPKKPIAELSSFKKGWFQVQDEAAQLVSEILDPKPHERVLDACAGLGGKTGHIAQLMQNRGEIVALDHEPKKLNLLKEEMLRLNVTNVITLVHDLNLEELPKALIANPFDRILLDAPCSGLGVMRRNPDIKWRLSKKNLSRYKTRQIKFLDLLAQLVKPGGIIVYAVCSTEPEEGQQVVDLFLNRHPQFMYMVPAHLPGPLPAHLSDQRVGQLFNENGVLQTFPHLNHLDGFTIAVLKRKDIDNT